MGTGAVGCGQEARPEQPPRTEQVQNPEKPQGAVVAAEALSAAAAFEKLNIRLVRAGSDPVLPDQGFDLKSERREDKVSYSNDGIVFTNNIIIGERATRKAIFLVWDENSLGAPITRVSATHRVEQLNNREVGEFATVPVLSDIQSSRWFVALNPLFAGDGLDEYSGIQHVLRLDLVQSDGLRRRVSVRFRATGPNPGLKIHSESGSTAEPLEMIGKLGQDILGFYRIEVRNPANRPQVVQLIGVGPNASRFEIYLVRKTTYDPRVGNSVPGANSVAFQSSAPPVYITSRMALVDQEGLSRLVEVSSEGKITLPPRGMLVIPFSVTLIGRQDRCSLPALRSYDVSRHGPAGYQMWNETISWQIAGSLLEASVNLRMELIPEEGEEVAGESSWDFSRSFRFPAGTVPSIIEGPFGCRGLF